MKVSEEKSSPWGILLLAAVLMIPLLFALKIVMTGFLVTIEEQNEFGKQPITKDQCSLVHAANAYTGNEVSCGKRKSSNSEGSS